jgi:hypothetical protein
MQFDILKTSVYLSWRSYTVPAVKTASELKVVIVSFQTMSIGYNEDPCVREFGLSVGGTFEEVGARILDAPQL